SHGPTTITVSFNGYVTQIRQNVSISAGTTTTEDFDLRLNAACIDVVPTLLEDTVDLGTSHLLNFTMTNSGAASADFELKEGEGNTAAPNGKSKATPVKRINGQFSPLSMIAAKQAKGNFFAPTKMPNPPPNSPPWTGIANYPSPIMDNTCAEIDGLIYCVGGIDNSFNVLASGNVYDPNSNSWSPIASM